MKRFSVSIFLTAMLAMMASAVIAQTTPPPPCKALAKDRTITYCYPIDNSTVSGFAVTDYGWIKDSLPHTSKMYLDGKFITGAPDIFNGGAGFNWDDKIHTYNIVVTDSMGTFQKSVSFRQSLQLPYPAPSTDRSIVFCKPANNEVGPSPVRISAVASRSAGISYVQLWVDGVKTGPTEHYSGTTNMKIWSDYLYLANGTHKITVVAKQGDGTSLKSTHTVQVVSYTP